MIAEDTRLRVILRPMSLDDVVQVAALDKLAFSNPWPARTYNYEVAENDCSRMFVLESGWQTAPSNGRTHHWWDYLLGGGNGNGHHSILGYSGMWHIADEAHISTIAVHPEWRGQKLGELLLWSMIRQAIRQKAGQVTLEVRVGNTLAQNLYRKYGFNVVGVRKGYYRDNSEDANMMLLENLNAAYRERMIVFGRVLAQSLKVDDR